MKMHVDEENRKLVFDIMNVTTRLLLNHYVRLESRMSRTLEELTIRIEVRKGLTNTYEAKIRDLESLQIVYSDLCELEKYHIELDKENDFLGETE